MNRQPVNCCPEPDQLSFKQATIADHYSLVTTINYCLGNFNSPTLNAASVQSWQNLNNYRTSNSVLFEHKFLKYIHENCYNSTGNLSAHFWQRANLISILSSYM